MKFKQNAVLDNVNLPTDIQEAIAALSDAPVSFDATDGSTEDELAARTGNADAILVAWRANITAGYLARVPCLKYIGVAATSTSSIDLAAVKARGITLTNVTDYGDEATAEFIFMQLLKLVRGDGPQAWRDGTSELNGKTIGIIGLGAVGQQVASIALGFNMNVVYHSRTRKPEWEKRGLKYSEINKLLSDIDILSINVPRGTRILNAEQFGLLKPGSILVQTSLGDIMDDAAFRAWIVASGNFAIMDYSTGEANYQAYKGLPRVIFSKVIAGYTLESKHRLGEKVVANLKAYLANAS